MIKEKIGQRIHDARKAKKLSMRALAELTDDLKPSRINNWERGTRMPGPEEAIQLAKALEISPAYLLGLTNEKMAGQKSKIAGLYTVVPMLSFEEAKDPKNTIKSLINAEIKENDRFVPVGYNLENKIKNNAFALRMNNSCMEPIIHENDILICDLDAIPNPGDFVVANISEQQHVIIAVYKQLSLTKPLDNFELTTSNPNWGNYKIQKKESAKIIAVVREIRKSL